MSIAEVIDRARAQGRTILTEIESKQILEEVGIPTARARLARTPQEAAAAALELGFPTVLKIVSPDITHKSDVGGVRLGLNTPQEVEAAFQEITAGVRERRPEARIEGMSVQALAHPGLEVIMGMMRDPQFGPVLMFGLGGILVEILKDIAFRIAPLEPRDARQMIREIKAFPLLTGFRNQEPADLATLERMLLRLSEFAEAHPEIQEMDLNPVLAYRDGAIAVDARIVVGEGSPPSAARTGRDLLRGLDRAFNPRTVAVVGDKGGTDYLWLRSMKTFRGKVYSVQTDPKELPGIEALGMPNYTSLLDIPDEVDYVVCAVPRHVAPRIVADCIQKGVGAVTLFTSGFAETETEEGIQLQNQIQEMAQRAGLLLIGPNCMGLYNRRLGVRHQNEQPVGDGGNVGFIAQSGTHCINFSLVGDVQGVRCSKTVSFGNAIVLDAADFLEYLAQDPETAVIGMYLEGVRDGRRFLRVLRQTTRRKPVVVWKGGLSESGARAIYSHTAALATAPAIWDAAMRQAGAIQTDSLDETIDVVKVLVHCKPTTGRRMGLLAMTGGQSVVITDAFERAGLEVPLLTASSYEKLASFFSLVGGSYRNPLDAGITIAAGFRTDNLRRLLEILEEDENVDAIAMEIATGFLGRRLREMPAVLEEVMNILATHEERSSKPFLVIAHPGHLEEVMLDMRARLVARGIAVFATFQAAAQALRRAIGYWRFRQGLD